MRCNLLIKGFSFLLLALQACACQSLYVEQEADQTCLLLSVNCASGPSAKVSTDSKPYEDKLSSLQILVFNSSGYLDKYLAVGTLTDSIAISVSTGKKTVWAVGNAPDLSSVATLSSLGSVMIDLEENSREDGFVMAGHSDCTLAPSVKTICPVTVNRLVCRVVLEKIVNQLPAAYGQIQVVDAWLSHVAGNCALSGSESPSLWYNTDGYCTDDLDVRDLLYNDIGKSLENGSSLTLQDSHFYCFPNNSSSTTALVVKVVVGAQTCYYPVLLDASPLQSNATCSVRLTVTGLGSADPDIPVEKGTISASITVAPWAEGPDYDTTI